jgi:hypothetical protein
MRTCSPDGEQRVASSRWVQCCAMSCMCERANKGSGKQITGKADTCKQGERGRSPTGKGLPCNAGMRTKGTNPMPRENIYILVCDISSTHRCSALEGAGVLAIERVFSHEASGNDRPVDILTACNTSWRSEPNPDDISLIGLRKFAHGHLHKGSQRNERSFCCLLVA